ncbi:hypothetical protein JCM8097_008523 [Rhodosporidiobolus ruineniae]
MLARTALPARPARPAAARARALHASAPRSTTHPAKNSLGNSINEDAGDQAVKNNAWPVPVAVGVVGLGYLLYANFYSGKEARQEKAQAKDDQAKSNPPAGSKENTGTRG